MLSPVSSLSRARALFSLLLLLLLFTLLSFSVSLSHFRSSLLREKLLLCPTLGWEEEQRQRGRDARASAFLFSKEKA